MLTLARLLEEDTRLLTNYSDQEIQLQWQKEVTELRALMLMTKWWKRGGNRSEMMDQRKQLSSCLNRSTGPLPRHQWQISLSMTLFFHRAIEQINAFVEV